MDPTPIVYGTVLAVVLVALGHRPWSRGPVTDLGVLIVALGFGLAHLAGWYALNGTPPLEPTTAAQWLIYLVPAAAVVSVVERKRLGWPLVWLLRAVLVGGFLHQNLGAVAEYREWSGRTYGLYFAALVGTGLWTLAVAEGLARRAGDPAASGPDGRGAGIAPSFALMVWGGLCAGLLGTTSSVSALTLGAMNTFFGVGCAVALLRRDKVLWRGGVAPFAFAAWAMLFISTYYGAVEELPAGILLLAPLGGIVPLGPVQGIPLTIARGLLIGAIGAVAIYLGWPEPAPYY